MTIELDDHGWEVHAQYLFPNGGVAALSALAKAVELSAMWTPPEPSRSLALIIVNQPSFVCELVSVDALCDDASGLDSSRDSLMTELCAIDLQIIDDFSAEPMWQAWLMGCA